MRFASVVGGILTLAAVTLGACGDDDARIQHGDAGTVHDAGVVRTDASPMMESDSAIDTVEDASQESERDGGDGMVPIGVRYEDAGYEDSDDGGVDIDFRVKLDGSRLVLEVMSDQPVFARRCDALVVDRLTHGQWQPLRDDRLFGNYYFLDGDFIDQWSLGCDTLICDDVADGFIVAEGREYIQVGVQPIPDGEPHAGQLVPVVESIELYGHFRLTFAYGLASDIHCESSTAQIYFDVP